MKRKILFFDLETTGLDPKVNGIHQISGMVQVESKVMEEFNLKFVPYGVVEEEALEVSGLSVDEVMSRGITHLEAMTEFQEMLGRYCDKYNSRDKFFLCGYNNQSFDNQFLRGFFEGCSDRYFGSWFWSNSFDVMVFATMLTSKNRHEMQNFKLATVAKQLGIEVDESKTHDALYDIKLTKAIFDQCVKTWYK